MTHGSQDHCVRFVFEEEVVRVGELDEMSAKTEAFALRSVKCVINLNTSRSNLLSPQSLHPYYSLKAPACTG
jgi:hypothetical protein